METYSYDFAWTSPAAVRKKRSTKIKKGVFLSIFCSIVKVGRKHQCKQHLLRWTCFPANGILRTYEQKNETTNRERVLDRDVRSNYSGDDRFYDRPGVLVLRNHMRKGSAFVLLAVAAGAMVGAGFFVQSGYEAYRKNAAIEEEIATLEEEARKYESRNDELAKKLAYFQTDAFAEREAKEKLGRKHKDEKVLIVKGRSTQDDEGDSDGEGEAVSNDEVFVPVYEKWYGVFFGKNGE